MKKTQITTKQILILSIIGVALLILFVLALLSDYMPLTNENVVGNNSGNLNNGGLFCESDGRVYFANAYDGYKLYSMNPDESDVKRLGTTGAKSINADKKYLYYYLDSSAGGTGLGYVQRSYGLFRCKKNGKNGKSLNRQYAVVTTLVDNFLYYQHYSNKTGTQLYKMRIDGKKDLLVMDSPINPACAVNGMIYFNGMDDDHYLYALDTKTDAVMTVWEENMWQPQYADGYIYYMDMMNNYRLCRYSLSNQSSQVVTSDRVDCFNVSDYYIYYAKSSEDAPALMRISKDLSSQEIVMEGVFNNINTTSQYVYFSSFETEVPVYKTPVSGAVNVSTFDAALSAAMNAK